MKINVLFSAEKNPDFTSSQIMKKLGTKFSHVLIQYKEDTIFHAIGKGVCTENLTAFLSEHDIVEKFEVELKVSADYFDGFVAGSHGKEYSQSQIAALGVGKGAENGDEKMICSELVGIVLTRMADYHIPGHQDSWTPKDCLISLKAGPKKIH